MQLLVVLHPLPTTDIFDILYFDIPFFYIPLISFKTFLIPKKIKITAIKEQHSEKNLFILNIKVSQGLTILKSKVYPFSVLNTVMLQWTMFLSIMSLIKSRTDSTILQKFSWKESCFDRVAVEALVFETVSECLSECAVRNHIWHREPKYIDFNLGEIKMLCMP